jgi:hypothetical protein
MFKKIDPLLVYSDEILNWSLFETRAYLVFASYANMNSGEFFIKHETLAKKIGSSKRQAQRIINKFKNKGIISIEQRPTRSNTYTFNISTMSTLQSEVPSQFISKNEMMMSTQDDIIDENQSTKTPETITTSQSTQCPPRWTSDKTALQADPHDLNKPKIEADVHHNKKQHIRDAHLTTTDKDLDSYNYLVRIFGKEVVDVAVENCKKLNGDAENFWGLVHWSCKTGIAPTNKNMKIAEKKEKHKKFADEQIEKNRKEQEERERLFAESDPELPNRLIAEFNNTHKED